MTILAMVVAVQMAGAAAPPAKVDLTKDVPPPVFKKSVPDAVRPIRVAVMDLRVEGDVPPRPLAALRQALTPELRKLVGVSAISGDEIRDMLGLERQKQMLGCSEESSTCLAEIAGAISADELIAVHLALVGNTYTLAAQRSDAKAGRVVQSQSRKFEKRDGEELLAIVGPLVESLYPERPLKPGKMRGIEEQIVRRLNPPPLPKWAFWSTAAASAAALAAGGTFGLLAMDAKATGNAEIARGLQAPVSGATIASAADRLAVNNTRANVAFAVAGGLAVAAGVQYFFTDWKDDRAALDVTPAVGPGGAGIAVGGRF